MPHLPRWLAWLALAGAWPLPVAALSAQSAVPILVEVSRYQFSPGGPYGDPIRLQAGVAYVITFRATDVVHGISSVPALGIYSRRIVPGEDYVVAITPTLAARGRHAFSCTEVCGAGHFDMSAAIEVEGADDSAVLWLNDGRFRVETTVRSDDGAVRNGLPVPLTGDSGYFWFFDPSNIEIVVKVLDGCAGNERYWVFAAGLTNLEVVLAVTDTRTGDVQRYSSVAGEAFRPVQDVAAFATCP